MIIFLLVVIAVLVLCNIVALNVCISQKKDLKVWEAVYESTSENNSKLTKTCENLMEHNKEIMKHENDTISMIDNDWKNLFNLYQEDLATHRHLLDQYDEAITKLKGLVMGDDRK